LRYRAEDAIYKDDVVLREEKAQRVSVGSSALRSTPNTTLRTGGVVRVDDEELVLHTRESLVLTGT